jgi:hypothetical protein
VSRSKRLGGVANAAPSDSDHRPGGRSPPQTELVERQMCPCPMIVGEVSRQHAAQMRFAEDDESRHSRRMDPIRRFTYGFCHGRDGAETTAVIPMPATRWQNRSL